MDKSTIGKKVRTTTDASAQSTSSKFSLSDSTCDKTFKNVLRNAPENVKYKFF